MNRLLVSAAAILLGALPAHAQSLVSGKVQTSTPSYTNDQNVPLSLDASGALRVTGGGSSSGSVTAPGTNGSQAQAVQGINGGVPVGISASGLPLPTGAATAANQTTELASLATIAQRAVIYNDAANTAVAANTLQSFTLHDLGAVPAYSKTNAVFFSSVSGTAQLLQCQDSGCAIAFIVSSQVVSAGQFATLTAPAFARYYRAAFQAGGTAGTVSVSVSATAD